MTTPEKFDKEVLKLMQKNIKKRYVILSDDHRKIELERKEALQRID